MKNMLLSIAFFSLISAYPALGQDGNTAAAGLFKQKCGICHTIGQGQLVGPDLSGVHERRSEDWLLNFIRSSQTMIKSGDTAAVALFEKFNQTLMPDPMISDVEIRSILSYIADNSGAGAGAQTYTSILADAGPEEVGTGRLLFEGRTRFVNKGPSCLACHNGVSNTFFNQNSYAKDLSASFSTLGEAGVRAILENPPFPVMAEAFRGKELTPDEVRALLAFLKSAGAERAAQAAGAPPSGFLLYGILGAGALIALFSGLWPGRKSKSVNHRIYERQIKSFN